MVFPWIFGDVSGSIVLTINTDNKKKKETRIEWKTKRIGGKIWPHVVENGDKLEWKMNAMRMTCPNTEFIIIVSWMLQQTVKVFAQNVCVCMCRFFCCFFVSFLCWATVKCWFRTEWVSNHTAIDFRRNRNRREKNVCSRTIDANMLYRKH